MTHIKLFHMLGAGSRVSMTALEHVGAAYEDEAPVRAGGRGLLTLTGELNIVFLLT